MIDSIVKIIRGIVRLRGATDNTLVGNVGDRLKVDTQISTISGGIVGNWSPKLRYLDMNASNGGIARGTTVTNAAWVDVFNYSGSGFLTGFLANLETGDDWRIRLIVDGNEIFNNATDGILTNDISGDSLYDLDPSGKNSEELAENIGIFMGSHNRLVWNGVLNTPIKYSSSVVVKVKRDTGAASKKFLAGLMILTKDT